MFSKCAPSKILEACKNRHSDKYFRQNECIIRVLDQLEGCIRAQNDGLTSLFHVLTSYGHRNLIWALIQAGFWPQSYLTFWFPDFKSYVTRVLNKLEGRIRAQNDGLTSLFPMVTSYDHKNRIWALIQANFDLSQSWLFRFSDFKIHVTRALNELEGRIKAQNNGLT